MLDILLVIIAIVVGGACVGRWGLSAVRGGCSSWHSMGTFQQAYGTRSYWPGGFSPGMTPRSFRGCRYSAVAAALARPAPKWSTASLDGWSGGGPGVR
jgi:hypothetical protein